MTDTPSVNTRIKFVDTVLDLVKRPGASIKQSLQDAEDIFLKAGLVLPSFVKDASYKNRGLPPRGAFVLLRQQWDGDGWIPAVTWDEATQLARVTSRELILGRRGPKGDRLPAFNARPSRKRDNSSFYYSPRRLYLNEEGITWRWAQ